MNDELEALIRARVIAYHKQYACYANTDWSNFKLCVITGDIGYPNIKFGTITIARYFPSTFQRDAYCVFLNIQSDSQSHCTTEAINSIKFCN